VKAKEKAAKQIRRTRVFFGTARELVRRIHEHKKDVDVCPLLLKTDTMNASNTWSRRSSGT